MWLVHRMQEGGKLSQGPASQRRAWRKHASRGIAFCLILVGCLALHRAEESSPSLRSLRDGTWRLFHRIRGIEPFPREVFFVALTREDIEEYGPWPWPRLRTAEILQGIAGAKPKAIAILFTYAGIRMPLEHALYAGASQYRSLDLERSGLEQFTDVPPIHAHEVNRAVDAPCCSCGKRLCQKH